MSRHVTIAAAQYPLDEVASLVAWKAKVTRWVEEAVKAGGQILVFPEYGNMELSAIGGRGRDLHGSIAAVSDYTGEIAAITQELARKHGVMIVAGSAPCVIDDERFNIAQVAGPGGKTGSYTKIMPTPWERDPWQINGGRELKVFDIGIAKVGLVICYDIEFPLLARALAEAGAEIILAPSNTETEWGYWRVRTGAAARALENQVYTVHSPCVGPAPFCTACEANTGMAGIFAPPDRGFPPNGVMALGEMNKPQWVTARVDLDLLAAARREGGVRTYQHWTEQPGVSELPDATVIDLR
ncbi:carbon-nitrogen hydrolase family protein [Aestuariivirga sp.]|uniref:carbon-nitrogen hydrolase family protein n=1 Tax=Aestuariivirga sp. TaxID=2650926 RepID=UPI0039E2A8B6